MAAVPRGQEEAQRRIRAARDAGATELDLSDLRLRTVPPAVAELTSLTLLNLGDNWLTEVPDWLGTMTGLTALCLGPNRLTVLPDSLAALENLTALALHENRLAALPDWIGRFTGLTELRVDANRLTALPDSFAALTALRELDIDQNRLSTLPTWLADCTELTHLDIGTNRLRGVPEWLVELTNLFELGLDDCHLGEVPPWLTRLPNLKELHLERNDIDTISGPLFTLRRLNRLFLNQNPIDTLPDDIGDLVELVELDLDGTGLSTLPERIERLSFLTVLDIADNVIAQLPDWLGRLTNLTVLRMRSNLFTSLPVGLAELSSLAALDVSHNQLGKLPDWIGELSSLRYLRANDCGLAELNESLAGLSQLRGLEVAYNDLTELPEWVCDLPNLKDLRVASCRLTELPDRLAECANLTILWLGENQFPHLPDWIGEMSTLSSLDISGLGLETVPEWVCGLADLTYLDLMENHLSVLPDWLSELEALSMLDVSGNRLTALPESLTSLGGLSSLYIHNNSIATLPTHIAELQGLATFYASECAIETVPPGLMALAELGRLQLGGNKLRELPEDWSSMAGLSSLTFGGNDIGRLPDSVGTLPGLKILDVANCGLTELPESFAALTSLVRLNLSENDLATLPKWLTGLPDLQYLYAAGNPLASLPPEIVEAGSDSVLAFLRAREKGSSTQWVSKLLVVGEGGVGKTSLVKRLAGLDYDPRESTTHGINIQQVELRHPERGDVTMSMSTWDFGGQQIYHATHQFFLTNRSLFVLLWNARLGWEQGRLRYWLDILRARAPESPVVLVATHTEGRPVDLPLDELRREYPRIAAHLSVDNETGAGVAELRALLAAEAKELPLMGAQWPTSWLAAADAVRAAPRTHVPPHELFAVMDGAGLRDETHQSYVATALHELGDILYYADDEELNQTVVLAPQWANEYISKVLDSADVAGRNGLLSRRHLDELWSDVDRGMRDHFLGMMDKYDLSYRVETNPGGDLSLVVERLPWNAPPLPPQWDELARTAGEREIRVTYRLNTMPPGIPTWFLARSHRFSTGVHWRTGALLRHSDGRHLALVHAQPHRSTVELTVRGPAPAAFFSVLDDGLNRTLERYPGLEITRQVPCPCQNPGADPCEQMFRYEHLNRRLAESPPRELIECHSSGEQVSVYRLLWGLTPTRREPDREQLDQIRGILERLDEKVSAQGEYGQRMFLKLQQILQAQQETRCPNVFTVVPARRRNLFGASYELRLYCEEPGAWHPLPDGRGRYPITEPVEWLRRFRPYLEQLIRVAKHAAPLAGPVLGITMEKVDEVLKADCDLMKEAMAQVSSRQRYKDEVGGGIATALDPEAHGANEADFRSLQAMLDKLDPQRLWGGLSRVATPEGETLFLCADHAAGYRRGQAGSMR